MDCFSSTGVHKRISSSPLNSNLNVMFFTFSYGFGYDPSTEDYLVVQAVKKISNDWETHLEIFSLRANTWKEIEGTPFPYMNTSDVPRNGLLFNGAIHWLAFNYDETVNVIVVFELVERSLSEIPLPDDFHFEFDFEFCDLCVLGGFLCFWVLGEVTTDIWAMEDYKVQSWTRTIIGSTKDIPTKYFSPICSTKSGDIFGIDNSARDRY
ncbi:F-box/kelch-repeat protein At3g06240-like [Gastrolobium bilobum]|uniref:F-box/kelch-repeat protein At3g06240-like n=1 Tax=Gastrolobium bilobum TaxID=150636 RepID=UPI002AB1B3F8|nr:F-box/kelch-repeat protein At3g06240-like [Gastrolobium bilobum]